MLNLSLIELKLIARRRGIRGYKSIFENKLLSALNASESVKMPDQANINKNIREIIKESRDKSKIIKDLTFLLDPEKDHYNWIKNYNKNKESSCIQYLDAKSFYGWEVSQKVPVKGFKWKKNMLKFRL